LLIYISCNKALFTFASVKSITNPYDLNNTIKLSD
jgi:hypothetical protein